MKRRILVFLTAMVLVITGTGCSAGKDKTDALNDNLTDIMSGIYEKADLSDDFRAGLEYFETAELTEDMETYVLGTDEVEYLEGIVSMPMMSSVAYQCVLLRTEEGKTDEAKKLIQDNADLNKWVCVSAETMLVESRGDVIFFAMGESDTVYALNTAFQSY